MTLMMALTVALMPQSTTLTDDPLQAPLVCAVALAKTASDAPPLFRSSTFSWFVTQRAALNKANGSLFAQLTNLKTNPPPYPKDMTMEQAQALTPQCNKRYPQASSKAAVALPRDPLARDAVCLFNLSSMGGAAGVLRDLDPAIAERYKEAATYHAERFDAGMAKTGLSAGVQEERAVQYVVDGLKLGHPYTISEACLKLPKT